MSRFGGLGVGSLNSLTASALPAIQNAINSFLQVSQFQQDQNRRKKEQERAIKEQKKAEKRAFGRSLATFGLSSLAGAGAGAALGSMAGPAAAVGGGLGGGAGTEIVNAASNEIVPEVLDVASATSGLPGAQGFISSHINNTASGIGATLDSSLGVPGSLGAETAGMTLGAMPPAVDTATNLGGQAYSFGNSLGSSVGKGALFGALSPVVPGILNAAIDIPYRQANLNLQSERLSLAQREHESLNQYRQQQIGVDRQQLGLDRDELASLNKNRADRLEVDRDKLANTQSQNRFSNMLGLGNLGARFYGENIEGQRAAQRSADYNERSDIIKNRPVAGRGPIGETLGIVDTLSQGKYPEFGDTLKNRLNILTTEGSGQRAPTPGELNSYIKTLTTEPMLGGMGLSPDSPDVAKIRGLLESRMGLGAPAEQSMPGGAGGGDRIDSIIMGAGSKQEAIGILNEMVQMGEIDQAEYQRRLKDLGM